MDKIPGFLYFLPCLTFTLSISDLFSSPGTQYKYVKDWANRFCPDRSKSASLPRSSCLKRRIRVSRAVQNSSCWMDIWDYKIRMERESQSRAGTYRLAREIPSEAVCPLSALGAVRAFSLKKASKRREKELLLEYPLLWSFLCLQSRALGVGIRNKKTRVAYIRFNRVLGCWSLGTLPNDVDTWLFGIGGRGIAYFISILFKKIAAIKGKGKILSWRNSN